MESPTLATEIAKALPVVIGGILALMGGGISQWLTHQFAEKRELSKLRRERLETMVKSLYAHEQWLEERFNVMLFGEGSHDKSSPLSEARMIQSLHFPEFSEHLALVQKAQIPLMQFVNDQRISKMTDQAEWIKSWKPEPYFEAYRLYRAAVDSLVEKARSALVVKK